MDYNQAPNSKEEYFYLKQMMLHLGDSLLHL